MKHSICVRRWTLFVVMLTMVVSVLGPGLRAASGESDDSVSKESKWGTFGLYLRYRFEFVDDAAVADSGYASTLRTVVHYTTPDWHELKAFILFKDVTNLGSAKRHNDTQNGVGDRPLIPDPPNTSVEQILLRYDGAPDTGFILGRQEINLGQQRFVGAVGWRQNHQTMNSFRVIQKSIPRTVWTYAYVGRTNNVTNRTDDMTTNLFNAEVDVKQAGKLTPYVYSIDYDSGLRTAFSTITYGARWQGKFKVGEHWTIPYHAELAQQDDTGTNPAEVDAQYYRLEARGKRESLWFGLGLEVLGGSTDKGRFTTPLATLHKWNGWADKFLVTPPDGLQDLYAGVGGKVGPVSLMGFYHRFSADSESTTYGQELDANVSYKAAWKQVFALRLAYYDADELREDTFKLWLWSSYQF